MEQILDIGLSAKYKEFCSKFKISSDTERQLHDNFEKFANYVIVSNLIEEELENVEAVSTNKSEGIDGIAIIINNRLISDKSDLDKIGEHEKLKIEICFIQSTVKKSFDSQKFQAFVDSVVKFLVEYIKIEPFSAIYSSIFSKEYIDRMEDTPILSIYFVSGKTKHELQEDFIEQEKHKLVKRKELDTRFLLNDIYFYQTEEIKRDYEKIAKFHSSQLRFDKNVQLESLPDIEFSLLAIIRFSELKKLILTKDGKLRERLFAENVRNYIGRTSVNEDIKDTILDENNKKYFPYLNNGITIMCDSIERHKVEANKFNLVHPRIINGCQTTHILFRVYKEQLQNDIDNIEVVAKIIATKDAELKKQIIFAANNQNSIDKDLQSLNDFHEKIETHFNGLQTNLTLYFERLRGQHPQITPPYCKINIEELAKVYISVFLKEPHKMKSNAIKKIREYQNKKKVFSDDSSIEDYYYCAALRYWFYFFSLNNKISMESRTMDMHLLMVCHLELEKKGQTTTNEKIKYISNEENALRIMYTANDFISTQKYLFERRGFYSAPKTKKIISEHKGDYVFN